MPRISQLPAASTANLTDIFPIVQGASTYSISFLVAKNAGMFLPANYSIGTLQLATNAVTADVLSSSASVDSERAVTTNHIRNISVSSEKLSDLAVTTPKLADGAVTSIKLADSSLRISKFGEPDRTFVKNAGTARPGTAVIFSGSVENVVVYNQGSGYTTVPAVSFTASPTGDTATGIAVLTAGSVSSVTITNPGSGYLITPSVTIDTGTGVGAKAVAYGCTNGLCNTLGEYGNFGSHQGSFFITQDRKVKVVGGNTNYKNALGYKAVNAQFPTECAFDGNFSGQGAVYPIPHAVFAGWRCTYLLSTEGLLYSVGYGQDGNLGLGTLTDKGTFNVIPRSSFGGKPIVKFRGPYSFGYETVVAITADGEAYGWGNNTDKELGRTESNITSPVRIGGTKQFSDAYIWGNNASSGLYLGSPLGADDGKVLCSGYNGYAQLSQGNALAMTSLNYYLKSAGVPLGSGGEGKVTKILGSGNETYGYTVILTASGQVYTAGYNGYGQLGNGTTIHTRDAGGYATMVATGVSDIYVPKANSQYSYTVLKKTDGSLWMAGYNGHGNFGANGSGGAQASANSIFTKTYDPAIYGGPALKVLAVGNKDYFSTYVLGSDGYIRAAGRNDWGQLGISTGNDQANNWDYVKINTSSATIVDMVSDDTDSRYGVSGLRVLLSNGQVLTCGWANNYSQGPVPSDNAFSPVTLPF
jgi:alpha-tubulin suppressor-like RCC1 family protein